MTSRHLSVNIFSCVYHYFSFSHDFVDTTLISPQDFVDNSHFGWEINCLLDRNLT